MVKKDNDQDDVPIEFYVPGPGGGRSKIPIPINQPNWVYKTNEPSKPYIIEWIATGIVMIIGIVFGVLLFTTKNAHIGIWILTIVWGAFAFFMAWSMIHREIMYSNFKKERISSQIQRRKRKLPKRRKDFGR